jgi:hypothetical protein
MSNTNTGGPAFPQNERVTAAISIAQSQGMTLRDYFAAKAMDGFNRHMVAYEWGQDVMDVAARNAYALADAMLKAREA